MADGATPPMRAAGCAVLALMLVPLTPTPLPVSERPPVPAFFATGVYREHLPRDAVVLVLPPGSDPAVHAMRWQTATGLDFATFGGYFLAPAPGTSDRTAIYGRVYPPTLSFLLDVTDRADRADRDAPLEVTATIRARAAVDVRDLGLTTIVLPAADPVATALRTAVDGLVGPGRLVADMWIWDVRR